MQVAYNILLVVAFLLAIVLTFVIFVTGKGDAMSGGGGGVRTSFKGKASIEDKIARATMIMGLGFMALMIVLDLVVGRLNG